MDISVILVAVLLFIPVYLMGFVSNNKILTIILAVALLAIVMIFAGEKYLYFDIMGIGIALYFAFINIDK